jgi:hypothetical protein
MNYTIPPVRFDRLSRFSLIILALLPFISLPIMGAFFYFRHDDSAILLWAKEFSKPFYYALSSNLEVNEFYKYPGMGQYWRPFKYLYVKLLWHLFETSPAPYYITGGIVFILTVYFFYRISERLYGAYAAVFSCIVLFITFNGTMYNIFHVGVEVSYFYQMIMFFFYMSFLMKRKWIYLAGTVIFLVPAMSRQTTPIILTAIFIVTLLDFGNDQRLISLKNVFVLFVISICFYILSFSSITSHGSLISVFPNLPKTFQFIHERFLYYAIILTTGITGFIILLSTNLGVFYSISQFVERKYDFSIRSICLSIFIIVFTLFLLFLRLFAVYWLAFCFVYLFIYNKALRLPVAWAGASLLTFFAVGYYHDGYLLEAGFPIALICSLSFLHSYDVILRKTNGKHRISRFSLIIGSCVIILILSLMIAFGIKVPFLSERLEIVRIAIDSNQNFGRIMDYIQNDIPKHGIIYEISEEDLGTSGLERRDLSLKDRATRVKIMSIEDKRVMLKVLERTDVKIFPTSLIDENNAMGKNDYLVALNSYEMDIAEAKYQLVLVKRFERTRESAAIYSFSMEPHR